MSFRSELLRERGYAPSDRIWCRMQHHPDLVISTRLTVRYVRDGSPHPLRFETDPGEMTYTFIHGGGGAVDTITREWLFVLRNQTDEIVVFSMRTGKRLGTVMPGGDVDARTRIAAITEQRMDARRVKVRVFIVPDGLVPPTHPDGTMYLRRPLIGEARERQSPDGGEEDSDDGSGWDVVYALAINIDTETERAEVVSPQLLGFRDRDFPRVGCGRVLRFPQDLGLPDPFPTYWETQYCFSPDGRYFCISDDDSNTIYVTDTVARTLLFTIKDATVYCFLSPTLLGVGDITGERDNFMIVSVPLGGRIAFSDAFGVTHPSSLACDDRGANGREHFRYVMAEGVRFYDDYDEEADFDVFYRFDRAAMMNEISSGGTLSSGA